MHPNRGLRRKGASNANIYCWLSHSRRTCDPITEGGIVFNRHSLRHGPGGYSWFRIIHLPHKLAVKDVWDVPERRFKLGKPCSSMELEMG